jgi:hypothetical protein
MTPYLVPGTTLVLKNFFLKVRPGTKCKNFLKSFEAAFGTWYSLQKNILMIFIKIREKSSFLDQEKMVICYYLTNGKVFKLNPQNNLRTNILRPGYVNLL